MSSNSVRVSNELFRDAQSTGEIVSRSAAQQVEYWARVGQALEASGVSTQMMIDLLKGSLGVIDGVRTEEEIRAAKRIEQKRDIEAVRNGEVSATDLIWFSKGLAKKAKALNSPY